MMKPTTPPTLEAPMPVSEVLRVFLCFAAAYFLSSLVRGVAATLAPQFSAELSLSAADLGLLAGAYFGGFALAQLPLGSALDRFGPRKVLLGLLTLAVAGCLAFAMARSFMALTAARAMIGVGVSACLMAPLTTYRRRFSPMGQMRANSWMLMAGSMGLVTSTLPVQWLQPVFGWRSLFWGLAAMFALVMGAIRWWVPPDDVAASGIQTPAASGYGAVVRHPAFQRVVPMGFFFYGGLVAIQTLWAGPWLAHICGWAPEQAAQGLFVINIAMMLSFVAWGALVPRLHAHGWAAHRLVAVVAPVALLGLGLALWLGPRATTWVWVVFCAGASVVSLTQPALGQAFPAHLAGRALSAFNLVIFSGVFALQWGIGLAIDLLLGMGWDTVSAYRGAFAAFAVCCALSYAWFLWRRAEPTPVLNFTPLR